MRSVRIVGLGRAGRSFQRALSEAGWDVDGVSGRGAVGDVASDTDLVLICTPDAAIAAVAEAIQPGPAVVAHVAGSLGLEALPGHERRAAIHPLMSLPNAEIGAQRLRSGVWFAIAGHPLAAEVVDALDGHMFTVADEDRPAYHAAACVASNHLVALMGQVERIAAGIGVPSAAYGALATASLENALRIGAAQALTGPAARGDDATIERHLAGLPSDETASYQAMVIEARRLAGIARQTPSPEDT